MLKLLAQSILELFIKLFDFLANKRTLEVHHKEKSYALSHLNLSTASNEVEQLTKLHPNQSGFSLLDNNLDAFLARSHLINNAEKTLDLQYYYFQGDTSGRLISDLLINAADRGVRIRLLLDDIDTLGADEPISILNTHKNIEIRIFNPFKFRSLLRYVEFITDLSRVSRRMHNKAMIMDNCQAIIGGRNIGDIYFAADPELLFLDVDLLAVGPIVSQISNSFDEYWNSQWAVPVSALYPEPDKHYALNRIKAYLNRHVQDVMQTDYVQALQESELSRTKSISELPLIWSDAELYYDSPEKLNGFDQQEIKQLKNSLREIVNSANSEITFITPYFVPGENGLAWFRDILNKGVKVSVITNSLAATDVIAVHAGYAEYRKELLSAGVNLYEIKQSAYVREKSKFKMLRAGSRTSLHAKIVIIDQQKVFIGSANLDPRSSYWNTEMGLLVDNATLACEVLDVFGKAAIRNHSYSLQLDKTSEINKSNILWVDEEEGQHEIHYSDPEASFRRRLMVKLLRLLPFEELL